MIDPITGLSLAANVIQFVDFASKLISKGHEIYTEKPGARIREQELVLASQRLESLAKCLSEVLNKHPRSKALTASELALLKVSEECKTIAAEFQMKLQDVLSTVKKNAWASFREAFMSIWNSDELQQMERRLERQKLELVTHLLVVSFR